MQLVNLLDGKKRDIMPLEIWCLLEKETFVVGEISETNENTKS